MALLELALSVGIAHAQRPTEGGLFAFSNSDSIETYDLEQVRVHYSVSGPNQTLLTDNDDSGVPDFVELVATTAIEGIHHFEQLGFEQPLTESDLGLGELGGSTAYDWYLVDFGGSADGQFGVDACIGERCSGYIVMENDFFGYGYPSREEAVRTLISHEYFHAVQAAYHANRADWLSEGTAVWAEHSFDDSLRDFFWLCSAYLEDTGRSLNRPPAGAISSFSYGTGLFYAFLAEHYGAYGMVVLQEVLSDPYLDDLEGLTQAIIQMGGDLSTDWVTFSEWNLATDHRSGGMVGYPYAAELFGLVSMGEGSLIEEDHRFYPLATSFFRVEHSGGGLQFVAFEETSGIEMSLHPVTGGALDGPVEEAIERWSVVGPMDIIWDLPAGGYWLVGSYPEAAEQSEKFEFCIGEVGLCEPVQLEDTGQESPTTDAPKDSGCQTVQMREMGLSALLALLVAICRVRFSKGTVCQ